MSKFSEVENTLERLNDLGSPQKIANYLEAMGVVGYQHEPFNCPVANYLHMLHGGQYRVGLSTIRKTHLLIPMRGFAPLPEHVRKFVYFYDAGYFRLLTVQGRAMAAKVAKELKIEQPPPISTRPHKEKVSV